MSSILLRATHPRYAKTLMGGLHRFIRAPEIAAMLVRREYFSGESKSRTAPRGMRAVVGA